MEKTVSVVIRTKNEEATIGRTLDLIRTQSYKPKEIILVDNNSSDKTQEIARDYGCKIVVVNPKKYNHAAACNEGVKSSSGEIIVFTNGHSEPISDKWIESGVRHFVDDKVAGTFGSETFNDHASPWDKASRKLAKYYYPGLGKIHIYDKATISIGPGLMATMSAAIRRDLWEKHQFDETVANSGAGEDTEWGLYFLRHGYKIVVDPEFSVFHGHKVNLPKFLMRNLNFYYSYFLAYQKSKKN